MTRPLPHERRDEPAFDPVLLIALALRDERRGACGMAAGLVLGAVAWLAMGAAVMEWLA